MDISTIIVSAISLLGTLIGTFAGIMTSTKLMNYRIEQLEKKVEKHNSVVERTAILEKDCKAAFDRIDELRSDVKDLERERREE